MSKSLEDKMGTGTTYPGGRGGAIPAQSDVSVVPVMERRTEPCLPDTSFEVFLRAFVSSCLRGERWG
jgi:hypothetical protein